MFGPGQLAPPVQPGEYSPDTISSLQQYLSAKEKVFAIYAQYQMTLGRLGILAGVRGERTVDSADAFAAGVTGNPLPQKQTFANPIHASHSYNDYFPSVQARYEFQPSLIGRATYSSTLARPGFNQANASLSVDLGAGIVTKGNPNLRAATADSFDLSLEKYLQSGGIASVGFFDKEISNYIVANVLLNQTFPGGIFPGNPLPLKVFTYTNAHHSFARGVELNWEQRFRELPGLWGGLGTGFNYTYVFSRFDIRAGERSPLPSTSMNTWNAMVFYERYGVNLRLAAYSASSDLFGIGSARHGDVFNKTRTSMDFGSSYGFVQHWTVYFNVKNLLDTPHAFFQGSADRPIQREFYGQTYQLGVRFDY